MAASFQKVLYAKTMAFTRTVENCDGTLYQCFFHAVLPDMLKCAKLFTRSEDVLLKLFVTTRFNTLVGDFIKRHVLAGLLYVKAVAFNLAVEDWVYLTVLLRRRLTGHARILPNS